jgi:hypothetical protein
LQDIAACWRFDHGMSALEIVEFRDKVEKFGERKTFANLMDKKKGY